jgi:hypothetical protein
MPHVQFDEESVKLDHVFEASTHLSAEEAGVTPYFGLMLEEVVRSLPDLLAKRVRKKGETRIPKL